MEIERKFLPEKLPKNLEQYTVKCIEQGYLCTDPVIRIRKENDNYILTYKSRGLLEREEYNLPLTKEAYETLRPKVEGRLITKKRYLIPLSEKLTVELDVFEGDLAPLILAEVEFETSKEAHDFVAPRWLGTDVTYDTKYHNSTMSKI